MVEPYRASFGCPSTSAAGDGGAGLALTPVHRPLVSLI